MTNAMIILTNSLSLMEQGVLKATGEKLIVEENGEKKELDVPEEIHTYAEWKNRGFQVQKGEKAKAQFPIWKYMVKKKKQEEVSENEEPTEDGYCRMVNAYFFTRDQVQPIEA